MSNPTSNPPSPDINDLYAQPLADVNLDELPDLEYDADRLAREYLDVRRKRDYLRALRGVLDLSPEERRALFRVIPGGAVA